MKANHTTHRNLKFALFISFCLVAFTSYSQKGTGDKNGVSRQQLNPELLKMEGTIEKVESGPCKYTTGKSIKGTHLMVKTEDGLVNIHLGPMTEVSKLLSANEGDQIKITVFKTDKLPKDQFIAKEIILNEEHIVLRDENLKPVWSGKKTKGKGKGRGKGKKKNKMN